MTLNTYWREVGPGGYVVYQTGLLADRPATPPGIGSMFRATDTGALYVSDDGSTWVAVGSGSAPVVRQVALWNVAGGTWGVAASTVSPTTWTATAMRVYQFELAAQVVVNNVYWWTNAALATNWYNLAIYNSAGTLLWTSGAGNSTAFEWKLITASLPITLGAGVYYFGATNANAVSATATFVCGAGQPTGGALVPRCGTYSTTAGAIPGSITPASIVAATVPQPTAVILSTD